MVVVLDLDEDDVDIPFVGEQYRRRHLNGDTSETQKETVVGREDVLNLNMSGFSAALACYP